MAPFPMHTRDDMISQMNRVRKQFTRYKPYGLSTIQQVLSNQDLEGTLILKANYFESSYIENIGAGKFTVKPLPIQAQFAPVFGIMSCDFNNDNNLDLLLAGNDYGTEVFTGRYDASIGLYLQGDGKGNFTPVSVEDSGFLVEKDAKAIAAVQVGQKEQLIIVTQNKDSLKVFAADQKDKVFFKTILFQPMDAWAEVRYKNGKKRKLEFYYGSSYLSQSSRSLQMDEQVLSVKIYDYKGNSRTLNLSEIL